MIYGTVGLGKICFTVLDAEEETFREGGFLSPVERDIERHAEVCQLEHVLQGSQEERQDSLARQQHPTLHPGTNNNNNFAVNDGSVNYDEKRTVVLVLVKWSANVCLLLQQYDFESCADLLQIKKSLEMVS